jgi:hypothetical protein
MVGKAQTSTRLLAAIALIVLVAGSTATLVVNWRMKASARDEARVKAMLILDRNLAIHTYFTHQLKPVLFETVDVKSENYFEPAWMSSTFAVREIDNYYQALTGSGYYYKECAINARSPENEADAFESAFIRQLNENPDLHEYATVRDINGAPFLAVLRRGEVMEQSCLRCHSTPEIAPAGLVDYYGAQRSFNRELNEVVSAISLRIPLAEAYGDVNRLILHLSLFFALVLLAALGAVAFLGKRWMFDPLRLIRDKALNITTDPQQLGEQIEVAAGSELSALVSAFNEMSRQLRKERDQLEERIQRRTATLSRTNDQLRHEVEERRQAILKLEAALKEIKTLRGILPICAYCKNIRDDKGYWQKLEAYIEQHSEAEFTHGICRDCARKLYPDLDLDEE